MTKRITALSAKLIDSQSAYCPNNVETPSFSKDSVLWIQKKIVK